VSGGAKQGFIGAALLCAAIGGPSAGMAQATDSARAELIEYLEGSGLRDRLDGQREGLRLATHETAKGIAAQVKQQVPGMPDPIIEEFVRGAHSAIDETIDGWSIDDAIARYARPFERAYAGPEMDALLVQLRSPEGHKLEKTLRDAMFAMTQYVDERQTSVLQRHLQRLSRQLAQRAQEFQATGK